jgi:hypothetical protein
LIWQQQPSSNLPPFNDFFGERPFSLRLRQDEKARTAAGVNVLSSRRHTTTASRLSRPTVEHQGDSEREHNKVRRTAWQLPQTSMSQRPR